MSATIEGICNAALMLIGASNTIGSIDEQSANALRCKRLYDQARLGVLARHGWRHAIQRAQLARLVEVPPFEWPYYYQLPADFVRLVDIYADQSARSHLQRYVQEAISSDTESKLVIATDAEQVFVRYIADNRASRDVNQMPALFREALTFRLARDLAMEITEHMNRREAMNDELKTVLSKARSDDTMNDPPEFLPWNSVIMER